MQKVYITGSSIICALGDGKKEAIDHIKKIAKEADYRAYLQDSFQERNFYSIQKKFPTKREKFYSTIETVVRDAISDAKLTNEEARDLHIFIGSTSMTISLYEGDNQSLKNHDDKLQIKTIGYGPIGDFVENLLSSHHKSVLMQSACTSSANAFSYAANLIKSGKIKKALVVGLEFFNLATIDGFNSLMLLSKIGECKPLDKDSDGIVLGEGCSAIVLDSKQATPSDFEYLSSHSNFDNYSLTNSHPNGEATLNCMKAAIDKSGLHLEEITCLKAHSTGSPASSLSEARAIDGLFKDYGTKIDVTSLKPFIGHTLGACGTNEITLLCEAIKSGFIPQTFGFEQEYEGVSFPVLTSRKAINRATVLFHTIGFGGSNNSIILSNEER